MEPNGTEVKISLPFTLKLPPFTLSLSKDATPTGGNPAAYRPGSITTP